jgi:DUF917 family protein
MGALAALEIGGGNGMINMITGASTYFNIPVVDGDFMVRRSRGVCANGRAAHIPRDGK